MYSICSFKICMWGNKYILRIVIYFALLSKVMWKSLGSAILRRHELPPIYILTDTMFIYNRFRSFVVDDNEWRRCVNWSILETCVTMEIYVWGLPTNQFRISRECCVLTRPVVRRLLHCPTLTKGSKWQITQIWESDVFFYWTSRILLPIQVWSRNTHPAERYL